MQVTTSRIVIDVHRRPEMSRLRKLASLVLLVILAWVVQHSSVLAAEPAYPSRPIRMIVPFPPGGGTDILGRTVAQALGDALGQSVLIDNRPGANTIIGAELTARATPDGYTLLLAPVTTLAINPGAYAKLPYDAVKDFAPVARLASNYQVISARLNFPANNLAELVNLAKQKPGTITYGSTGNGAPTHFGGVLLEIMAGIKMIHVPYKGNSQVLADLVGGQVDLHWVGPASVQGLVKAGKVKLLAATSDKRLWNFPDLQTVAEGGYAGYTSGAWYAVVTRAGAPRPVVERLNREINLLLSRPDVKVSLEKDGFIIDGGGSPADTVAFIAAEIKKWASLTREAGVRFE